MTKSLKSNRGRALCLFIVLLGCLADVTKAQTDPICWVGDCDGNCVDLFNSGNHFTEQNVSDGICAYLNGTSQVYQNLQLPSCIDYCRLHPTFFPNDCDGASRYHCCEEDKCLSPVETPLVNQNCIYILKNSDSESDAALVSNCEVPTNPDGNTGSDDNTPDHLSCWNFNCFDVTCGPMFNESLATTDPTSVRTIPIDGGKCVITETGGTRFYGSDSSSGNCTDYCSNLPTRPGDDTFNCNSYNKTHCCDDQDFCLSPKEERDNSSCLCNLFNSEDPDLMSLWANCGDVAAQCQPSENNDDQIQLTPFDFPPNPISYTTLTAESGYLTFSVNETVTGFDYVNLFINEGTDAYVCMAISSFEGNQNYTCIIPGLAANKMYNITLQGHNPDRDNGTVDGLTEMSEMFSIYQDETFKLTCGSDGYQIEFYSGDLTSSKASVILATQTTPQTSETGTSFDELVATQSSWYGEMVFVPPTSIFKGYPNAIVVQQQSNNIIILTSLYDFIDTPIYNGDPDSYDETLSEMFNLTDKRVVSVSGSFKSGFLNSIQFEAVDDNGDKIESNCYGGGDCSEFTLNQTDSNQFFVGFAGKTNAGGKFKELTTHWASVSTGMYYLGNEDCMLQTEPDWNDISKTKYSYSVKPSNACGTVHSVVDVDGSHTVVYDNKVSRQTENDASHNNTFGEGSMKASRQLSGALANVKCSYEADGDVIALFDTGKEKNLKVVDIDSVPFELDFYTDNSFSNPIRCPKEDDSFMRMESVRSSAGEMMDPLSIQAFYWFDDPNMVVYLHCKVRACPTEDKDNCTAPTTCDENRRRRREIMLDMIDTPLESLVFSQPITIQKETVVLASGRIPVDREKMWLPMSVFCGIMAVFLVIILNAFRKHKLNNFFSYRRLKDY